MVQVTRREHESNTAFIRRFTRTVQRFGIIIEARKGRFHATKPNRTGRRRAAARRDEKKKEYDNLYKMGKLED